jgi:hypothetical protein
MARTRRGIVGLVALGAVVLLGAQPALACGGLVGPGGTVELARTTTLAGYHDGVEHYLTSFRYAGGGTRFGSIVPLPAVPTEVAKGGAWVLPRLVRETQPRPQVQLEAFAAARTDAAEELFTAKVDALDLTVLRGGGRAVGDWARERGFGLSVDAPEVLDFYAARSPVFLAASFDAGRAAARGQRLGDSTAIHLTIPTANPWVPLRILGLGRGAADPVQADVYLLTDRRPALLPGPGAGVSLERSGPASARLLADLRADQGMGWLPAAGMWLSYLRVDTTAGALRHDLAVDASGRGRPSPVAAGLAGVAGRPAPPAPPPPAPGGAGPWGWLAAALAVAAAAVAGRALAGHGQPGAGSR